MPTSWRDVPITLGPDGLYHSKVTVGRLPNGRLDRRHRSGHTEAEVKAKLRDLFRKLDAGTLAKAGKAPTVESWFRDWLTNIAPFGRKKLSPTTLQGYWSYYRTWIVPELGAWPIDALQPEHLDALYAKMRRAGRKDGTLLQVHAILRRGLGVAQVRGRVTGNVAALIDPPGTARPRRTPLSMEAAKAVVDTVTARRNAARWLVGLCIGFRQGEALGLCWPQVDLDAGTVEISWQLQRLRWQHGCEDPHRCGATAGKNGTTLHRFTPCKVAKRGKHAGKCSLHPGAKGCPKPCAKDCARHAANCPKRAAGGLVLRRPKTWREDAPPRVVALPPQVVEKLKAHRQQQREERMAAGNAWRRMKHPAGGEADFVFRQVDGAPIDPRQDWGEFQDILTEAGFERSRVHALRHTAATTLLDLGIDIAVVQEMLGHAQIQTTRGYTTVRTAATATAAKKIGDALFGASVTDLVTERQRRRSS